MLSLLTDDRRSSEDCVLREFNLASYFEGGIENEGQLERALDGIREECSRWIGAGKKVIVQ